MNDLTWGIVYFALGILGAFYFIAVSNYFKRVSKKKYSKRKAKKPKHSVVNKLINSSDNKKTEIISLDEMINLDKISQDDIFASGTIIKTAVTPVKLESNVLDESLKNAVPKPPPLIISVSEKIAKVPSKHRSLVKTKERTEALKQYDSVKIGDYIEFDNLMQANRFVHVLRSSGLKTSYRTIDDNNKIVGRVYKIQQI